MILIEFIFFIVFYLVVILSTTKFKYSKYYSWLMALVLFFTIKWLLNYRKCTISYIEVKLRGVKKEEGLIYNYLNKCVDLRQKKIIYLFYFLSFILLVDYFVSEKIVYSII